MPIPRELQHVSVIRDETEALSTLNRALAGPGATARDDTLLCGLLCGLLTAKAAVIAVNQATGQVVMGFHRLETPQHRRWFTIEPAGMTFVWESDGDHNAALEASLH
jgi:hypothetical protein